jgi:tetratricopeptide (TPR) repeat protein
MARQSKIRGVGIWAIFAVMPWFFASSLALATCAAPAALSDRVKTSPNSQAFADAGNWFAGQKQFDCAATAFASAFQLNTNSASLAYLWGLSLYSAGRDEPAIQPLSRAKQLDPSDIRPHLVLAEVLHRMKKTRDAEAEWRAALAIDPDSEPALDGLSQDLIDEKDYTAVIALLDKPGSSRVRSPQQSLNLGIAYAVTAQLDAAAKALREGLNNDPGSLPIADELSMVLMLQGRDEEAFRVLDLALEKHPDDQKTQILYLRIMVSSHNAKAVEIAHKLLTAYPDQWEVSYLNGVLESQEADSSAARTHLERSISLKPDYPASHAELGKILAQLGELSAAREHLEKAIALGDTEPETRYSLAMALKRLGDVAEAQEMLQTYQQLNKARADKVQAAGKAEEGDQAMSAGDAAQAATLYREALSSDPDEPLLYYKLSKALDKLKDIAGEREALQRAIQLNANFADAQDQMGYLAAHEGDVAQAENYFHAAVRAAPSNVPAWINLAATLASESKWQEAKEAVSRALEIDPENSQARQLSRALADSNPAP